MTTMYIIRSGDLVWQQGTFGRNGKFVNDPTLFKATIMTLDKAQARIADEVAALLAWPPAPGFDTTDWQCSLDQWQAARPVRVRILEDI